MIIRAANRINGTLQVPGDKSISHRASIVAALAQGMSQVTNYSSSADCGATLACLRQLGVRIEQDGSTLRIQGGGRGSWRVPASDLDCGNSGTTMRLLAGCLAGQNFAAVLNGDASLRSRPMQRVIEPLQMMGAQISAQDGHAPLTISGGHLLQAIDYELIVASAQVKSSILLAGLGAHGRTAVIENEPTRDHTERMLSWFGAAIETGRAVREPQTARFAAVTGPADFSARDFSVPGDISSAAYFVAAAALIPGSSLEIREAGLNPTRILFLREMQQRGFRLELEETAERCNEPIGTLRVIGGMDPPPSGSWTIEGLRVPQLIDELPLLAVIGSQIEGGLEVRDARELRVKESDRIATTVRNLSSMGAMVEEYEDGFGVRGPIKLQGARIATRGDHRIAMAFSIAGLIAAGETEIDDAACVAVSFPEFFSLLQSVVQ